MTGNAFELFDQIDGESFFDENLIGNNKDNVYIDIGAYTGDTIYRFYAFSKGKYKKIIGVEAEKGNYSALCNMIKYTRLENVKTLNNALWSEAKKMKFYTTSQKNIINYDSSNLYRDVINTVDWKTKEEMRNKKIRSTIEEIKTQTIDDILIGEKPTIIKVNALGADLPILYGDRNTILNNKPIIIMEYGSKPEYILEQIEYLKKLRSDYKFYFRQKKIFYDSKTILYAI